MTDPYSPWSVLERRLSRVFQAHLTAIHDRLDDLEELVRAGNRFDRQATETLMLDTSQLLAEARRARTADESLKALCLSIADAIEGAGQAQVDEVVNMLRTDTDSVVQFVLENTPAAGGGDDGGSDPDVPVDGGEVPGDTPTDDGGTPGEPVG